MVRDSLLPRQPKVARLTNYEVDDEDELDEDDGKHSLIPDSSTSRQTIKKAKVDILVNKLCPDSSSKTGCHSSRDDISEDEYDFPLDEDIEENLLGFCCSKNCTCSSHQKSSTTNRGTAKYISASPDSLWHRRCCHNVMTFSGTWLSPLEAANKKAEALLEECMANPKSKHNFNDTVFLATKEELKTKYMTAKRHEAEFFNEDTLPDPSAILETSDEYAESRKLFEQAIKSRNEKKLGRAVVIDMFGGIGSGIVALKRLGIGMKKIIHVDHDKVATHVHSWNHDPLYKAEFMSSDATNFEDYEIEHIHIDRFEEVRDNIDDFFIKHGPIDIIMGGPPCVDYSGANADRQGTSGTQGHYMLEFGKLIKDLQQRQEKTIYFLAENTIIRNSPLTELGDGDLSTVLAAYGISYSVDFDSKDVSPCRRKRTYITNIPFCPDAYDLLGAHSTISMCIDDGFLHAGHLFDPKMIAKANCFMAHQGRIDDGRMLVYKWSLRNKSAKKTLLCRYLTTVERELAMGLPSNYVELPVSHLFDSIQQDGFGTGLISNCYWKVGLHQRYHIFSGNYHNIYPSHNSFTFKCKPCAVELKLAAPQTSKKNPSKFNKEGYMKHLIGNAFSVPTVALFFKSLRPLFETQEYKGYDTTYHWTIQLCSQIPNESSDAKESVLISK